MGFLFKNNLNQYKNWNLDKDIVVVDRTPMFSAEEVEKYEYPVFCVNSEKGIFYPKKRKGNSFDLVLVDKKGSSVVMKDTFVAASDHKCTCVIIRNTKENKCYLLDTRGELFVLPEPKEKVHFFGPGQYGFTFDKKTGNYLIRDYTGLTLWEIKGKSDEETAEYLKEVQPDESLSVDPEFKKFIKKLGKQRYLIYTCDVSKQGQIIKWLMDNGLPYTVMPNVFVDDDTVNIMVEVNLKNSKREDVLYLLSKYTSSYSIFNIPIVQYLSAINSYEARHEYNLNLPKLKEAQIKMCDSIINTMKLMMNLKTDKQVYETVFKPILDVFYVGVNYNQNSDFSYAFIPTGKDKFESVENPFAKKDALLKYESDLLLKMNEAGIKIGKWTNEIEMFVLLNKVYPDCIYQYHAKWLGRQSLDVYVPSLKLGFEYQGLQHFEPVDYFGGEEGFKEVQERDKRKKRLCESQGITLIYWGYDEPINELVLKKKLKG